MILKETILSAFTERGTLLKWLKKVEAALNNAVLVDVSVEQISTTQVKLKFTFENGDFVESPIITLPQGSAGVGFDNANELSINDGSINITADDNGINIAASFEVAVGEEILEIPSSMYLPFKGSESIVIDVDESGDFVEARLDAVISNKISRALVTPMSAPSAINLVGVDASNSQIMVKIGDGLVIDNGVLKLSQPTSPSSIAAGTYMWHDNVSFTSVPVDEGGTFIAEIPFISNGVTYSHIGGLSQKPSLNEGIVVYGNDGTDLETYVYSSAGYQSSTGFVGWQSSAYKSINVTATTEVGVEFAEWFKSNTTEVS